ncbi:putative RNA-binding protein 46 [Frankliniella fusca]|uniref:RNA-binding protein 46 n=1 Tax=Frankliniella fusca TaxID=407009 RepID=A0AAE1GUH7_9NEOP|nr:putative RNA-binding protein 46 [Frankliniella fusca]
MARHSAVRYSDEINDKLIKWMNETGYNIVQINGQRISTSPRTDKKPGRGCEVFVGKIPRDCYEDELFPVFQRIGPIHELRLMMMFSGTNRGYAFVMYERLQDAQRAVQQLDNYEIRRGHRIGVLPCVNNCRLFVGCFEPDERAEAQLQEVRVRAEAKQSDSEGRSPRSDLVLNRHRSRRSGGSEGGDGGLTVICCLPGSGHELDTYQVLRSETEHVVSVNRRGGRNGRWYLLVEYQNHRAAAIARRELTPRRSQLFGPRVIVDWEIQLDKRGRKLALEQRRSLKASPAVMKLYKGIGAPQLPQGSIPGSLHVSSDDESIKSGKQLALYSHPLQAISQCDSYHESWMKDIPLKQERLSWPSNILQLNSLNQSPGSISEWYTDGPTIQRPVRGRRDSNIDGKCAVDQDIYGMNSNVNHVASRSSIYELLMGRAQQDLFRSTDSSLYSDPEGQRPFSSESSDSARSSLSVSNLEGSTTSSNSIGSTSASWDQSLLNDMTDSGYSDIGNQRLIREKNVCQYSPQYQSWQPEEQSSTYLSSDLNNNRLGVWNSYIQSKEDHELIDDLFMKDDRSSRDHSLGYGNINLLLQSLSLSDNQPSNASFGRAIEPPKPSYCILSRGKINTAS